MNYYNDNDRNACAWLRELIVDGLIPPGEVDQRSIADVGPDDLAGFSQCHFFAGVAGWPLALQLTGVSPDEPVWTGSCPCQPFSVAGKGRGTADERHLWPEFLRLIRECRPAIVFGEQVASKAGRGWLAGVRSDLEELGYAVGAADLCAPGVNAPHIRQRLYWVGHAERENRRVSIQPWRQVESYFEPGGTGATERVADAASFRPDGLSERGSGEAEKTGRLLELAGGCSTERVADGIEPRLEGYSGDVADWDEPGRDGAEAIGSVAKSGRNHWSDAIWHPCRDGKLRRIPAQPVFQCLVDGLPGGLDLRGAEGGFPLSKAFKGRVMLLRGYGNAIVPQLAAEFVKAFMECQ